MDYNIFQVESDPQIFEYKNDQGEPIWMFMRYLVLYDILSNKLFNVKGINNSRNLGIEAAKYLFKSTLHNLKFRFNSNNAKIIFYTSSRGILQNGKYLNQYVDRFATTIDENSISIEHPPLDWNWYSSRINNNIIYAGTNLAIASTFAKFNKKDVKNVEKLLEYINQRIKKLFGMSLDEMEKEKIIIMTCYEMTRMNVHAKWILNEITRHKSEVAIILGGAYSWYYPINRLLKNNGIVTADMQHGYITSSNVVYNYSSNLLGTDEVKIASPDYLLTYGSWWNDQSNLPFKDKIVIGNPFRNDMKKDYDHNKKRTIVLLIGCARNTNGYIKLAEELSKIYDSYQVIFRPHPSERLDVQNLIKGESIHFQVDYFSNLYQLLEVTAIIISEISTVLFESIGLVPRIIVWRTDFSRAILPVCPFENFNKINELIRLEAKATNYSLKENLFWDNDWEGNFKNFIKRI